MATRTIGRFEYDECGNNFTNVYYRRADKLGVVRHRVGFISNRQFRRVTPERWNFVNLAGHHLGVIQSTAALNALRAGLIGPP